MCIVYITFLLLWPQLSSSGAAEPRCERLRVNVWKSFKERLSHVTEVLAAMSFHTVTCRSEVTMWHPAVETLCIYSTTSLLQYYIIATLLQQFITVSQDWSHVHWNLSCCFIYALTSFGLLQIGGATALTLWPLPHVSTHVIINETKLLSVVSITLREFQSVRQSSGFISLWLKDSEGLSRWRRSGSARSNKHWCSRSWWKHQLHNFTY